jgi:hypothetical protein
MLKVPSASSCALSFAESEEMQVKGLASEALSVPSGAINLCTYRLRDKPSHFIIFGRTPGMGSMTEVLVEQAARGPSGTLNEGLTGRNTCRCLIGSV